MENTEQLTKFLRNKSTPLTEIYQMVQSLFQNSTSLFLPNSEKFVLDLVCDRLSQQNQFTLKFKLDIQFWEMFRLVWDVCNGTPKLVSMRSKILSNLKFGEILSQLISDIEDKDLFEKEEYIESVFSMVNLLIDNGKVSFSQDQNLNFIKTLSSNVIENDYSIKTLSTLTQIIHKVFKLANSNVSKYDTKHVKEFSTFVLPNILIIINRKLTFDQSYQQDLQSLIESTLFRSDSLPNILENIEFFLNSPSTSQLESEEFIFLLKLIIPQVKITELEEIYKKIIESNPIHSGPLLKEITSMNKTLSTDFLSSLVERELKANDINLDVISYSIQRNSEVGLKYQDEILKLCLKLNDINLLKVLFDCFMNGREVHTFVDIWAIASNKNETSILTANDFIEYTSSKLVSLSNVQLSSIVGKYVKEYNKNTDSYPVVLISISKGLLRGVAGSVANATSKTLIQNLNELKPQFISLLPIKGKYSFNLAFYILSLFDLELIKEEIDLNAPFLKSKSQNDDHYYYSYFRIIEQDIDLFSKSKGSDFVKYYLSISNDSFKLRIFNRWLVLIDVLFEQEQIDQLISKLFKSKSIIESQLIEILSHPLIADQSKIMTSIINFIKSHPKNINYLNEISLYVYTKNQRSDILDLLLENAMASKLDIQNFNSISLKLLQLPTFKSTLETKFDSLVKLIKFTNNKDTLNVISRIFQSHVGHQDSSNEFLIKSFKKIEKGVNKSSFIYIQLSMLLVEATNGFKDLKKQRVSLLNATLNACIGLLNTPISSTEISTLIKYISNIVQQHKVDESQLKPIIEKLSLVESKDIQDELFDLITNCSVYDSTYILALYVVLNDPLNYKSLDKFISGQATNCENYISIWNNVLYSMQEDIPSSINGYFDILTSLISNCQKPEDIETIQKLHQLVTTSISQIFTSLSNINDLENVIIIHILNSLKQIATSKGWLFSQYSVELTLSFISNVCKYYKTSANLNADMYIQLTQTMSAFVLYQRYRFKQRHHLIVYTFVALLNLLISRSGDLNVECGLSFERLMSNLCEPSSSFIVSSNTNSEEVSKDVAISNALAQLKSNLRKNLHVLLFNYIKFYLQYQIDLNIKTHLDTSVFMILDLFTTTELHYINKSLDNQGRVVFKKLYEDYQKYYKWKED